MTEPENLLLKLLGEMRAEMATKDGIARLDTRIEDARSEMRSLAAGVASDMLMLEKRFGDQISALRRAVMEYHSSAIGHGVLISEFEERLRKVEELLNMTSPGAHSPCTIGDL